MRLNVKVFPNAKEDRLVMEEGRSRVYLAVPPIDTRMNSALKRFLAKHFYVKMNKITIINGRDRRNKLVEVRKG